MSSTPTSVIFRLNIRTYVPLMSRPVLLRIYIGHVVLVCELNLFLLLLLLLHLFLLLRRAPLLLLAPLHWQG